MKSLIIFICFCLFANFAKADEWRLQPGAARDIAVGAYGDVWSIGNTPTDGSYNIQRWNGNTWINIDGGGIRIAVDPAGNPWVINRAYQIFKREANRWVRMPGAAIDIGIGADGSVWVIGTDDNILGGGGKRVYKFINNNWTVVTGGGVRISVGPNGQPFIVNNGGQIYERLNSGAWSLYPGAASDISVGANGNLWVVGRIASAGGYSGIHKWNVDTWEQVDGGATQIAVDAEGKPWITNHLFEIYKRTYTAPVYRGAVAISPIMHDYPYTGAPSCIAANPSNQNNLLIGSGSGGVYETTNALASARTWTYNSTLTNPNIYDLIFATDGTPFTALAAAGETFKNNAATPQIWQRNSTGTWSLARFVAGTSIPPNKTSCYKIVKAEAGIYYACGDFGIAIYGISGTEWTILDFPPNIPVYSIAALKNGTLAAGTPSGIYNFDAYGGAFGATTPRWNVTNPSAIFTDASQRYQLNSDFSGSILLYLNRRISSNIFYSDDATSWFPVLGVPPLHPKGEGAGGFETIFLDSLITGNYSILVSNRFKFYQANIYGNTPFQGLEEYRTRSQQLQWTIVDDETRQTHDDTRQFLKLRGDDGTNKIVITTDGGFHISNFNFAVPNNYNWQTERTTSGLNNLEVYNLTGTNTVTNFGTQHNLFGALNASLGLIASGSVEGYVISRRGMGDIDARTILFDPNGGLQIPGPTFGLPSYNICGTNTQTWVNPNLGWGVPIWLGNKMYIQDATPASATPAVFPWRISIDNGCTWQNLPDGNGVRMSKNAFFSVRNNIEQNLYVSIQSAGINKLARLVNPHIISRANWATPYPAMNNLDGGIALIGGDFLYNPVFCVNPTNPDHILALENETGKLKVSNDGGNNWEESSSFTQALVMINPSTFKGSKNNSSIKSMSFSPFDSNLILVGTVSEGLFISRNSGNTWERFPLPGLYNITDFHWRTANNVIISTYGHGLFSMTL